MAHLLTNRVWAVCLVATLAACEQDVVLARRDAGQRDASSFDASTSDAGDHDAGDRHDSGASDAGERDGGASSACDPVFVERDCYRAPDWSYCHGWVSPAGALVTSCTHPLGSGSDGAPCSAGGCDLGSLCWLDDETSGTCWRPCHSDSDCLAPRRCDTGGAPSTEIDGEPIYRCIATE